MARRKQPVIPDRLLDRLLSGADAKTAFEKDGLLDELKKALAERALNAEIDHHLESGEADGRTNGRNGYGKKQVFERDGHVSARGAARSAVDVRSAADRQGSEAVSGFDEKIVSMYARGMTTREI